MNGTPKSIFGTFAIIEMMTWALLIAAIIARETIGLAPNMFFIAGATHGFAFIGYSASAVLVAVNQRWPLVRGAVAVMLAIVPFATVPFEKYLEKRKGWGLADYESWSEKLLKDEIGFVVSSSHQGEPNTRFAIVNPLTSIELLSKILESMK
jgi:integral membrane protein